MTPEGPVNPIGGSIGELEQLGRAKRQERFGRGWTGVNRPIKQARPRWRRWLRDRRVLRTRRLAMPAGESPGRSAGTSVHLALPPAGSFFDEPSPRSFRNANLQGRSADGRMTTRRSIAFARLDGGCIRRRAVPNLSFRNRPQAIATLTILPIMLKRMMIPIT